MVYREETMLAKLNFIKEKRGFIKYLKNTSWLIAEKILRITVGFIVGIWVTRYLGPERFGLFSYAQSFVGLFLPIATLGLDGIIVRDIVNANNKMEEIISTAFLLKLAGAIIAFLLIIIAINFTLNDRYTNILIFIISGSIILQAFNVIDMYFQAHVLSKYMVLANVISLFISSIIKIFLIFIKAPLIFFVWTVIFDNFILCLGFIFFFFKYSDFRINNFKFNNNIAIGLLADSWPLILSNASIAIYMRMDQVMIQNMLGSQAVGQYAAAVRLGEAWYFIPAVICSSFFPAIINAKKKDQEIYHERLQKLYDVMTWMAIGLAIFITIFAIDIVNILYGPKFDKAAEILVIHIWTGVFVSIGMIFSRFLMAENLTRKLFIRAFIGAILNVILNFILIPKYGIRGAAIATLVSHIIVNYIYDIFDKAMYGQLYMKTKSFLVLRIFKVLNNEKIY